MAIKFPSIIEDALSQLNFWNNVGRHIALVKRLILEVEGNYRAIPATCFSHSKRGMTIHKNNNDREACSS